MRAQDLHRGAQMAHDIRRDAKKRRRAFHDRKRKTSNDVRRGKKHKTSDEVNGAHDIPWWEEEEKHKGSRRRR